MRALITGSEGFVGRYLRPELEENGDQVLGMDLHVGKDTVQGDLLQLNQLHEILRDYQPEAIYHLAGQANVWRSWKNPAETFTINTAGTANLLEAIREECPEAGVLIVGSSDQYGFLGSQGDGVREEMETRPQSPYAISKDAQEKLGMLYAKTYQMRIIATRSFNHGGAGQGQGFMIPDFAAGIVRVERGEADCLRVGNLEARRDFTHVRDVVRAYRMLMENGRSGEVYNVGSGKTWQVREILDRLCAMAKRNIPVEWDPERMRPSDTPVICCDRSKVTADTGWEPQLPMTAILRDTLDYYRNCNKL